MEGHESDDDIICFGSFNLEETRELLVMGAPKAGAGKGADEHKAESPRPPPTAQGNASEPSGVSPPEPPPPPPAKKVRGSSVSGFLPSGALQSST
jgi:hypothetical protein